MSHADSNITIAVSERELNTLRCALAVYLRHWTRPKADEDVAAYEPDDVFGECRHFEGVIMFGIEGDGEQLQTIEEMNQLLSQLRRTWRKQCRPRNRAASDRKKPRVLRGD